MYPQGPLTDPTQRAQIVENEEKRPTLALHLNDPLQAFLLETGIPNRQNLVEEDDIGQNVHGNAESDPHHQILNL